MLKTSTWSNKQIKPKKCKQKKRKKVLSNKLYNIYWYTHTYVLTGFVKLKNVFFLFIYLGFLLFKLPYYHILISKEVNEIDLLM